LLPPIPTPPPQQAVSDKDGIALLVLPVANPVVLRPNLAGGWFPDEDVSDWGCSPLSVVGRPDQRDGDARAEPHNRRPS
jgi:hypothetical protein